jgi:hypothetical protein
MRRFPQPRRVSGEEDGESVLADFDETIAADLESTRRNMVAITEHGGSQADFRLLNLRAVEQLMEEMKEQRRALAKIMPYVNLKASKAALLKFQAEETARADKRLDSIRNWAAILIAASTIGLTLIKVRG